MTNSLCAEVIRNSGQERNTSVVLYDGTVVDVMDPQTIAFSPLRLAISLYNIQRWNGHLRIPAFFSGDPGRLLVDGDPEAIMTVSGEPKKHVFYSDLSHSVLVAICALHLSPLTPRSAHRLVRHALLHEAAEAIIGDMVGPFKRLVKAQVKAYEDRIDEIAYASVAESLNLSGDDLRMPDEVERAEVKAADIMAQDIEAVVGLKTIKRGVNVSRHFAFEPWMLSALMFSINATPADFVSWLVSGFIRFDHHDHRANVCGSEFRAIAAADYARRIQEMDANGR